jgi:hypothetical protein
MEKSLDEVRAEYIEKADLLSRTLDRYVRLPTNRHGPSIQDAEMVLHSLHWTDVKNEKGQTIGYSGLLTMPLDEEEFTAIKGVYFDHVRGKTPIMSAEQTIYILKGFFVDLTHMRQYIYPNTFIIPAGQQIEFEVKHKVSYINILKPKQKEYHGPINK